MVARARPQLAIAVLLVASVALPARVAHADYEEGPRGPSTRPETTASPDDAEAAASSQHDSAVPSDVDRRLWYEAQIQWRDGRALGLPWDGALVDGMQLPVEGQSFFTWDPVHMRRGNPDDRRWGTDELIRTVLGVLDVYRAANPGAPRVGVEDLSRPGGGEFGVLYGGLGHRSHQNGLDVDITYPRRDGRETGIWNPHEVDLRLAQDLVDRFVEAGAQHVFVGPSLDLRGPPGVVQPLAHHDDHLHVRIRPDG